VLPNLGRSLIYYSFIVCTFCCSCAMLYSREKPSLVLYIIKIINIVGHLCYGCQGLLHALSRDILNRFHFSRELQLDFFFYILVPVLDFIYTICRFSTLILVPLQEQFFTASNFLQKPTVAVHVLVPVCHFRCMKI